MKSVLLIDDDADLLKTLGEGLSIMRAPSTDQQPEEMPEIAVVTRCTVF